MENNQNKSCIAKESVAQCATMDNDSSLVSSIAPSNFTSENGECVSRSASPRYRFIDENGKHLHTLDGIPLIGTSTAVQVLGKGGLTWWAAELAAVAERVGH